LVIIKNYFSVVRIGKGRSTAAPTSHITSTKSGSATGIQITYLGGSVEMLLSCTASARRAP